MNEKILLYTIWIPIIGFISTIWLINKQKKEYNIGIGSNIISDEQIRFNGLYQGLCVLIVIIWIIS